MSDIAVLGSAYPDGGNHPDQVMAAHQGRVQDRQPGPGRQEEGHHQVRYPPRACVVACRRLTRGAPVTGEQREPRAQLYQIRVGGRLGQTIRSAFPTLRAQVDGGDTVLTGVLADQAALYGVLAEAEALGLELIEVCHLPPDEPREPLS